MSQNTTEERIAALEKINHQSRRLLWVAGLVLVVLALAVIEGYREMRDLQLYGLRTTSLKIFDGTEMNSFLVSLGRDNEKRPYFKFVDERGKFRAYLKLDQHGPSLAFFDSSGNVRLRLAVRDNGGLVEILNADGKTAWSAP